MSTTRPPSARGSLLARNALINAVTLAAPLIVAFVTLPFIIDGFGAERFGIFSIVWLLLVYLSEIGFGTTTTRFAAEAIGAGRTDELAALAWSTAALQAVVGLMIGAAVALSAPVLVERVFRIEPAFVAEAHTALYVLALSLPILGWARAFRGLIEAAQRFDLALAVHLPITIVTYLVTAWGAQAGWSLPAVLIGVIAVRLIAIPAFYAAAHYALPGISLKPALRTDVWPRVASFAGWVAVSTIVSPLLVSLDRFMIGALLSMTAVALYAAPYEIVGRLTLIPGAIVGALLPALTQLSAQPGRAESEQLAARSTTLLLVLLGPVAVVILGAARDGLALWLGAEFAAQSTLALQILVVGFVFNALAHVPYTVLHSTARPDLPARFHLLELPLQLVLAWILISAFGITGAALAWSLRMLIDALLLFGAAHRLQQLRWIALRTRLLPRAAALFAICGLAALAAAAALPSLALRLSAAGVLGVVSAAVLWTFSTSAADRQQIIALIRRRV